VPLASAARWPEDRAEMDRWSDLGFLRAGVCSPALRVADVPYNVAATIAALETAAAEGVAVVVFPELGLTSYSCGDLFGQTELREAALHGLAEIAAATKRTRVAAIVGLPLEVDGRLYNAAAVCGAGRVAGIVPKTFLPTGGEFYEARWFSTGAEAAADAVRIGSRDIPFGTDLLFEVPDLPGAVFGVEICEDLWAPVQPSGELAVAGATVLLNLSASDEVLGKAAYRRDLVVGQSGRCLAAYLYAASGPGESTTDVVYSGASMIAENGQLLAETERFRFDTQLAVVDLDLERLRNERIRSTTFGQTIPSWEHRRVDLELPLAVAGHADLRRTVSASPFVPADPRDRAATCREIFAIQATGLARRLRHTGAPGVSLGLSGGLDSTLALLATIRAFEMAGLARDKIRTISMPGPGTSQRTRANAARLAGCLEVGFEEIPIDAAVAAHLRDIGHPGDVHDIAYENAQARERTQILMDHANLHGGFVVGTGDLSEAALGWMTYGGDHLSMYHVNAGVPKTLVRYLVEWAADEADEGEASAVLRDIVATPISPELLPDGHETETAIGPFRLHDFFLYWAIRHGFGPRRIVFLASHAFGTEFDRATVLHWLRVFYQRFFGAQFKRSAMPDGPKVGTVALSPRGDWRMPSDAQAAIWLAELDELTEPADAQSAAVTPARAPSV
jgi:NAD+ synthase (glutamine-hydrolysing)